MAPTQATDEVLGPVRYCPGCAEWWPDDDEFWDGLHACRACVADRRERRRAHRRAATNAYRARQRQAISA